MPAIMVVSFGLHPVSPHALSRHLVGEQAGRPNWIAFAATDPRYRHRRREED